MRGKCSCCGEWSTPETPYGPNPKFGFGIPNLGFGSKPCIPNLLQTKNLAGPFFWMTYASTPKRNASLLASSSRETIDLHSQPLSSTTTRIMFIEITKKQSRRTKPFTKKTKTRLICSTMTFSFCFFAYWLYDPAVCL